MRTYARLLVTLCAPAVVIVALLMLVTPASVGEPINALPISGDELAAPAAPLAGPVVFVHDPSWPEYAQTEITLDPEPPIPGRPVEICAWVINTSDTPQTVTVDFGVANFGIGLPFTPIDSRTITVPPFSRAKTCVIWIPQQPGHWCLQAILHVPQFPDERSQRNIDIWEYLHPGIPADTVFPVQNSTGARTTIELSPTNIMPGWVAFFTPPVLTDMGVDETRPVTLTVVPPQGVLLGSREPIVDVEARSDGGAGPLIGGFRKLDWPPVPLHRMQDPPYAESEITIEPYPPLAGEPTRICVELRNISDEPQKVDVGFEVSQLGIGLPFTPIDHQQITIAPHDTARVCTMWVPPQAGHFCVQIRLIDPQQRYVEQISQRNMDVNEVLPPGEKVLFVFPVQNPQPYPIVVTLTAQRVDSFFDVSFDVPTFPLGQGEIRPVTAFVTRTLGSMPDPGTVIADIEATYLNDQQQLRLLGGIRKEFQPPIPIHRPGDPPYAEREITINPYPPRAGEPTEICVELRNSTDVSQTIWVEFAWANFGIGLPFHPFHGQEVTLPPHSIVKKCTTWVPPFAGHFCAQIRLIDPQQRYADQMSQRNMDVGEIFVPGQPSTLVFPVGNSTTQVATVTLGLIPHVEGWAIALSQVVLPNMGLNETRLVTLTVTPPSGVLFPEDDTPIVDVEAYIGHELIGGFRKIYRPPITIHPAGDPIYAESEIHINPYPPGKRQPTEICTDIRNPTDVTQTFTVTFAVANFGIGLPFHDIARPIAVTLPPHSIKTVCITWVPPFGGHFCAKITIETPGHDPVWSQRNMDVGEIFVPGQPSMLVFPVGNSITQVATVTLGLVPHIDGWGIALSQVVLPNMQLNETRLVTLTVTPPLNQPFPPPESPVVDVEGYIGRELIGGFRKILLPPVPVHPPKDPPYAESEIFIDPYPVWLNQPTVIGSLVFNPTDFAQQVTVTFGVAHFGIGIPFTTTNILTPTTVINIPPHGQARVKTIWIAQYQGHVCVQIKLQSVGHEPVYSQRNIDVGEPLRLGESHSRIIEVRNPMTEVVTITLALINHRPEWQMTLTPTVFANVNPGVVSTATLTVQPPQPSTDPKEREEQLKGLADEQPIADVEAYVNGELIGGIRKIAKPPVPLHKPQDPPYAESEISVKPEPLVASKPATITTEVMNTSDVTQTIRVEFWVANFGFGIPFTNTNIAPTYRVITLTPGMSQTVGAVWTPPGGGHWCIQIRLRDQNNQYPDQVSQRNVDVERREWRPCVPFTKDFWLQNSTALTVTVSIGANAINLPAGWTYSTNITETLLLPYQGITVTLTITPPCGLTALSWLTPQGTLDTGGASGPATIDVEGYVDGELLGGIEVQFDAVSKWKLFLPIIRR
jgi:hypothetical protein